MRPSHLVFAMLLKNELLYFLETSQARAPCHGGGGGGGGGCAVYFFYIDGMLSEFFMNFLNIDKMFS